MRGIFGYLPHIGALVYLFMLLFVAIKRIKVSDLGETLTIFYIVFISLVSVAIETFTDERFVLSGSIVASSIIYYTYLYVQVFKTDPLTKVYNRTSFNKDVEKKMNKSIGIINVDIDNLKTINDVKGHAIGDKAIITLSNVLVEQGNGEYRVYRVGGDEFYVLGFNKTRKELESYISSVNLKLSKLKLSASFGSSIYKPGDDFKKCCIISDEKMYINKKKKPETTDEVLFS